MLRQNKKSVLYRVTELAKILRKYPKTSQKHHDVIDPTQCLYDIIEGTLVSITLLSHVVLLGQRLIVLTTVGIWGKHRLTLPQSGTVFAAVEICVVTLIRRDARKSPVVICFILAVH